MIDLVHRPVERSGNGRASSFSHVRWRPLGGAEDHLLPCGERTPPLLFPYDLQVGPPQPKCRAPAQDVGRGDRWLHATTITLRQPVCNAIDAHAPLRAGGRCAHVGRTSRPRHTDQAWRGPFELVVIGAKAAKVGETLTQNPARPPSTCHRLQPPNAVRPINAARRIPPRPAAAPKCSSCRTCPPGGESLCDEVRRSVQIATLHDESNPARHDPAPALHPHFVVHRVIGLADTTTSSRQNWA